MSLLSKVYSESLHFLFPAEVHTVICSVPGSLAEECFYVCAV